MPNETDALMPDPDPLYVTEAECAQRVGVSLDDWKTVLPKLERIGLPGPSKIFPGKRYWPAIRRFFDSQEPAGRTSSMKADPLAGESAELTEWLRRSQRPRPRPES
jgi:hypothetical protein